MTSVPSGSVVLVAFMAWAVYRRVRRNIGRQKLQPRRIIVRMAILSVAAALILSTTGFAMPLLALTFAGGTLLGVACAFLGLRHTKFETTGDGHFYTPNTYIGVALSVLLLGRVAYRLFLLQNLSGHTSQPQMFQSPLTLGILGVTIGYYLTYYIGLFVHTHDRR